MSDHKREPVLVSACLLGISCRYDGRHSQNQDLERDLEADGLRPVGFCPEEHGGLGTPRDAAWIEEGDAARVISGAARVVTGDGRDVTEEFLSGARGALAACRTHGIRRAYLKERSPSCGVSTTHVGGVATEGPGVTARLLSDAGVEVRGV